MLRAVKFVFVLLVFCLGIVVAFGNSQAVTFDYLAGTIRLSLVVILIGAMLFGFVLALILSSARIVVLRTQSRRLRRDLDKSRGEVAQLRSLPSGEA